MGAFAAGDAPEADRLVGEAVAAVGRDVSALVVPGLRGVVLCGGYARGEGGVVELPGGGTALSNDLDFYVVAEDGLSARGLRRIDEALRPVAERRAAALGIHVDFSPAKTPSRMKRDERRVMVQELLRGWRHVCGEPGESLFAGLRRIGAEELPWMEAARYLMNRGFGLMLAADGSDRGERDFGPRNIAKCVLGAGDARLIVRRAYAWSVRERAAALGDPLYVRAMEWKFRPSPESVCGWEAAREAWLGAFAETMDAPGAKTEGARRTLAALARWIARRGTFGTFATAGLDPTVRVLLGLAPCVESRRTPPPGLVRDWEIFN